MQLGKDTVTVSVTITMEGPCHPTIFAKHLPGAHEKVEHNTEYNIRFSSQYFTDH